MGWGIVAGWVRVRGLMGVREARTRGGSEFIVRAWVGVDYIRLLWLPANSGRLNGGDDALRVAVRDHDRLVGGEGLPWNQTSGALRGRGGRRK